MTARHGPEDFWSYVRTYITVFLALMVLTLLTVAASYSHLAIPLAIAVALLIAIVKGSLVAGLFMHLIAERQAIFALLIVTAVLLAALIGLPLAATNDQISTPSTPWTASAATQAQARH